MGRRQYPLAARIKKVMQSDEDVGRIAQATPILISVALELFLKDICENTGRIAQENGARIATPSHLKAYVMSEGTMDFLQDKMVGVPDLDPNERAEPPAKRLKRQDSCTDAGAASDGGGRGGGRGRGRGRGRVPPTRPLSLPPPATATAEARPSAPDGAAAAAAPDAGGGAAPTAPAKAPRAPDDAAPANTIPAARSASGDVTAAAGLAALRRKPTFLPQSKPVGASTLRGGGAPSARKPAGDTAAGGPSEGGNEVAPAAAAAEGPAAAAAAPKEDAPLPLPLSLDSVPNHVVPVPEEDDYDED